MMRLVQLCLTALSCASICSPLLVQDWTKPCSPSLADYCLGHGTCRRMVSMGTHFCACHPGYEGPRCQYRATRRVFIDQNLEKRSPLKLSSLLQDMFGTPNRKQTSSPPSDEVSGIHQTAVHDDTPFGYHQTNNDQGFEKMHEANQSAISKEDKLRQPMMAFLDSLIMKTNHLKSKFYQNLLQSLNTPVDRKLTSD